MVVVDVLVVVDVAFAVAPFRARDIAAEEPAQRSDLEPRLCLGRSTMPDSTDLRLCRPYVET